MAGSESFAITVTGKGGHGASPQFTADPVIASAQIITALQSIISRNVSPFDSAVVSVTMVHGGSAMNIIPSSVELQGTIRAFRTEVFAKVLDRFKQIVGVVAEAMGCEAHITLKENTIPLVNSAGVVEAAQTALKCLLPDAVIDAHYRTIGSEDMAYFLDKIPGAFIFVGSSNEQQGKIFPHHHPRFDIDEDCLPAACALLVQTCLDLTRETISG